MNKKKVYDKNIFIIYMNKIHAMIIYNEKNKERREIYNNYDLSEYNIIVRYLLYNLLCKMSYDLCEKIKDKTFYAIKEKRGELDMIVYVLSFNNKISILLCDNGYCKKIGFLILKMLCLKNEIEYYEKIWNKFHILNSKINMDDNINIGVISMLCFESMNEIIKENTILDDIYSAIL